MRKDEDFVDYYELLEISPNATRETIERVFRFLAKRCHPDSEQGGDINRFKLLVEACEVLSDPATRIEFDREYEKQKNDRKKLVEETDRISDDSADRCKLLSLFYAQRRRDRKKPGLGNSTLEHLMQLPPDILDFHLWYFRSKGWIEREESGLLSITAEGVDQIENRAAACQASGYKRIEFAGSPPDSSSLARNAAPIGS